MNEKVKDIAKKTGIGIAITATVAYILFAYFHFNHIQENSLCKGLDVVIKDSSKIQLLRPYDIRLVVKNILPDLQGTNMNRINTTELERSLVKDLVAIKDIECFKTPDNKLKINIWQRRPILRISRSKGDYYIDEDGKTMPIPNLVPAFVPVANGEISDTFALKHLYPFAQFLRTDKFWDAQIEQIYVRGPNDVCLVPRVGSQVIEMGSIDNFEEKFENLEKVYHKGFSETGWNTYSVINLKYEKQVICTKK